MSQIIDGPRKSFIAAETGGANLRWYISDASTSPPTVSICDSTDPCVGVNEAAVLTALDPVTLYLANASGTRKMVAAGVITGGNKVYAADDGEVASTGTLLEGVAFETTTADQDILEVMGAFGEDVDEDWADDETLTFGTGDDAVLLWSTGDASAHAAVLGLGDTNGALHITDKAARASDWALTAETHPTIYLHSNTTPITDYVRLGDHDGTACWLGDVVGGATAYIGFDGLEVLEFTETATAVNHLGIVNAATGNKPIVRAEGESDTGLIFDSADGEEALILSCTASAVNEITISSAATGNNPIIACTGEANTGLTFQNSEAEEILILDSVATSVNELTIRSAATGNNPIIAATGEADSGIELHNDQAEQLAIFECVATAVNEITFSNAATAGQPSISATGETNVGLKIASKGTGTVDLYYASTEIASVQVTGLAIGTYVVAGTTAGTDQLTLRSTGTAPTGTGANAGHLFADYEADDDELFWLSGTGGTATQLTT
ncbi:MAG TPA: hypothetical protein VMX74_13810 [Pirellulales bacterium]|nr:hypothetical protein [Pirellulales bacterium]